MDFGKGKFLGVGKGEVFIGDFLEGFMHDITIYLTFCQRCVKIGKEVGLIEILWTRVNDVKEGGEIGGRKAVVLEFGGEKILNVGGFREIVL